MTLKRNGEKAGSGMRAFGVASGSAMSTYDVETGKHLWNHISSTKRGEKPSAFYMDDVVWSYGTERRYQALDAKTGTFVKFDPGRRKDVGRCGPDYATEKYILGMDFSVYDMNKTKAWDCYFARADCAVSYIPANGGFYAYGHQCKCGPYLTGVMCLSCEPLAAKDEMKARSGEPLQKGSAFHAKATMIGTAPGWATFRANSFRGNAIEEDIPVALKKKWTTDLGGVVSAPTVAAGKVYVAMIDKHQVKCLLVDTGDVKWTYTASARVDTPPTLYKGYALFGSRDGWVYCVLADSGELVWRFRAAPEEHLICVRGQFESKWPVFGSVLVENDKVYCAAGRHGDADGGIFCYALEPATGEVLLEKTLSGFPPFRTNSQLRVMESWEHLQKEFNQDTFDALDENIKKGFSISTHNEILQSDGETLFIGAIGLDLVSNKFGVPTGMNFFSNGRTWLADNTDPRSTDRNVWMFSGKPDAPQWRTAKGRRSAVIKGNLLTTDGKLVYGLRHEYSRNKLASRAALFAYSYPTQGATQSRKIWNKTYPEENNRVKALIAAGDYLYTASQPGGGILGGDEIKAGEIFVHEKSSGKIVARAPLGLIPVFDGMAASGGKLFISTEAGKLVCMEEETDKDRIAERLDVGTVAETFVDGVLRINCGSVTSSRDACGNTWKADQKYESGSWGYIKGGIATREERDIEGTNDDQIYLSEHYNISAYRMTVPNGKYTVRLHFAEAYTGITESGQRVFDVSMEKETILNGFDPFKESGEKCYVALVREKDVTVSDGELTIEFQKKDARHGPMINGIEVIKK